MDDPLKQSLKNHAANIGLSACGIAPPVLADEHVDRHTAHIANGFHADMEYLSRRPEARFDARSLLQGCNSVVAVALGYYTRLPGWPGEGAAKVARYALGEDYHRVMRGKLRQLGQWLEKQRPGCRWKATVDTSPIAEKQFAIAAGIGWQGKHSIVLNREYGSYFVLGLLLTDVELEPDSPQEPGCGSCTRCIDACPAGALPSPHVLDARRCISYITTARKGPPVTGEPTVGWVFGCDACQIACPYNAHPPLTKEPGFSPKPETTNLSLNKLAGMEDEEMTAALAGTELGRRNPGWLRDAARHCADSKGNAK